MHVCILRGAKNVQQDWESMGSLCGITLAMLVGMAEARTSTVSMSSAAFLLEGFFFLSFRSRIARLMLESIHETPR